MEITTKELRQMASAVDERHRDAMRTFKEEAGDLHLDAVRDRRSALGTAGIIGAAGLAIAAAPALLPVSSLLPGASGAELTDVDIAVFAESVELAAVAIYSDPDAQVTDPSFRAEVQSVVDGLPGSAVSAAVTYYDTQDPSLISQDGHSTQVLISLQGADQNALLQNWDRIQPRLQCSRQGRGVGEVITPRDERHLSRAVDTVHAAVLHVGQRRQ